jgi:probable HAF family extracellular repeat protein
MKSSRTLFGLSAILAASHAAGQATFTSLGWLPGGVTPVSRAYAISDNGLVIVGASSSSIGKQAFRWTSGSGLVGLGILPGGTSSTARRVSANGSVVVGESGSTAGEVAFRWTSATGMVDMGDLPGGTVNSNALGVSSDGSVIVGEAHDGNHKAFRWTAASGMVSLGLLNGATVGESHGYDVTSDGGTVCGYSTDEFGRFLGFRWTAASGMTSVGDLPGGTVESRAYGISRNGLYVTGRSDAGLNQAFRAFRWSADKMLNLGVLANHRTSRGRTVSDDGTVVIGRCGNDNQVPELLTAFIWTDTGGMEDLKTYLINHGATGLTGWHLEEAEGMTPDGRYVVGHGTNPSGNTEAWVAKLPVRLTSNVLSLPSVYGGFNVTGTVKLSYASTSGTTINLSSSDTSAATVPASITIPAGQTSGTYTVTTKGISVNTKVTIMASFGSDARGASTTVKATNLKSYSLTPANFYGGGILTGKVALNGVAPAGGATVTFTTGNSSIVPVPASIVIPAGESLGSYAVSTNGVANDTVVALGASYGGVTKTVNLTVRAAVLSAVTLKPSSVASGKTTTVSVTLLGKAAAGGKVVNLAAADASLLSLPASVTVPEGSSTASVVGTAATVSNNTTVAVNATASGVTKSATLTILAPTLSSVALTATTVTGGSNVNGSVTLSGLAPAGGIVVSLSSSDPSATVPATVTVGAGLAKGSFVVHTTAVGTQKTVTISATYLGVTKQVVLTINP